MLSKASWPELNVRLEKKLGNTSCKPNFFKRVCRKILGYSPIPSTTSVPSTDSENNLKSDSSPTEHWENGRKDRKSKKSKTVFIRMPSIANDLFIERSKSRKLSANIQGRQYPALENNILNACCIDTFNFDIELKEAPIILRFKKTMLQDDRLKDINRVNINEKELKPVKNKSLPEITETVSLDSRDIHIEIEYEKKVTQKQKEPRIENDNMKHEETIHFYDPDKILSIDQVFHIKSREDSLEDQQENEVISLPAMEEKNEEEVESDSDTKLSEKAIR